MTTVKKIILLVLTAILVVTAAFSFLTKDKDFLSKITGTSEPSDVTSTDEVSETLEKSNFTSDYPLVQTQQRDIFYEAHPDGTIKFYKFANGTFTQITEGVNKKDVTLTCSYQKVKFKLHYLKADVGTIGYGLFNSTQSDDTKLFSYIFVRMMDCPKAYASYSKTDYVLLTDMDAEDAYNPDKTYSDMYSYNIKSETTTLVVSQRDRLVQRDGTMREDWTIFTDSMLNSNVKHNLFATRRFYDTSENAREIYDIISVKNSRATKKASTTTVTGSPSYVVREKDGAYFCFANTKSGFDLIKNGDKKNPLASFQETFDEYSVSRNYILNKTTCELTDITSGTVTELRKADFTELSGFAVNDSASKAVLFCNDEPQSIIIYDTATGEEKVYTDNLFNSGICNFCFIDDNTLLSSSYDENGKALNTTITV